MKIQYCYFVACIFILVSCSTPSQEVKPTELEILTKQLENNLVDHSQISYDYVLNKLGQPIFENIESNEIILAWQQDYIVKSRNKISNDLSGFKLTLVFDKNTKKLKNYLVKRW